MTTLDISPGFSHDADEIRNLMIGADASRSITFDRSDAFAALADAYEDSREPNWDGYGATPAFIDAYIVADRVLRGLPSSIPSPEIDITPQGKILFEWYRSPRHVLSMSIGPTGEVAYAVLSGRRKQSGTDLIIDFIPEQVLNELQKLYS